MDCICTCYKKTERTERISKQLECMDQEGQQGCRAAFLICAVPFREDDDATDKKSACKNGMRERAFFLEGLSGFLFEMVLGFHCGFSFPYARKYEICNLLSCDGRL